MINLTFDIEVVYLCNLEWVSALFFFYYNLYKDVSGINLLLFYQKMSLCMRIYIYNICENHSIHTHMYIIIIIFIDCYWFLSKVNFAFTNNF